MMGLFSLALPVACIDLLRQHLHVMEGVGFPYTSNLILELLRQPIVEVVPEGTFTIATYLVTLWLSDMDKLSKQCSASPTGLWGLKFAQSSWVNSE